MDAVYATFDSPQLPEFRQALVAALASAGITSPSEHGFVPHITLAYVPSGTRTPPLEIPPLQIEFAAVFAVYGETSRPHVLIGPETVLPNVSKDTKAAPNAEKFLITVSPGD